MVVADRPLTTRSVLASTLLGTHPPRMPAPALVRAGALFGLEEGAVRTALSRMVAAGDATRGDDGWYELTGELAERQRRQEASRSATTLEWSGAWTQAVVEPGGRSAADRAALRRAMGRLRMAELRDGVWCRPDNLGGGLPPGNESVLGAPHRWFRGATPAGQRSGSELAAELWDLGAWAATARGLIAGLEALAPRLAAEDLDALPAAFVASADALRHLGGDPLLPAELSPADWPGAELREAHRSFDDAFGVTWRRWHRGVDGSALGR